VIHRGLLFWSVAAIGTAMGLFSVKYRVQDLEEKIDRTNLKIVESQQATHMLQIEWDYLNEAARIERLAQTHLKLEQASIKQVVRLDSLAVSPSTPTATASTASVPPRRDSPLPSPPRTGTDVPSSRMPGGDRVAAEAGSPSPASAPPSSGPTTPPRSASKEPTSGPVGGKQRAIASIDDILSRKEEVHR